MKKIISIFGIVLFAFALTLSSCGDNKNDSEKETVECSGADDCAKACCLGCKATEGEKKCIELDDGTMPCCTVDKNVDIEKPEDHGHSHDDDDRH